MSAATVPALPVNGAAPSEPELKDVLEYEKILKLRDQIFAGIHPRLKVPPGAIRKVTPRSVQTPPLPPPPPAAKEVSTGPPAPQTNGISQHNANSIRTNSHLSNSPVVTRPPPPKLSSSELDPIFLTKSDTLKHAEVQLKRQRIERALRDEVEQKKKTFNTDDKPDFDVSEVLAKALELVKPVALSDANGNNATASDSFDENSLYSSRAPDSTPEQGHYRRSSSPRIHQHHPMDVDDYDADTRAERNQGSRRQGPHEERNIVDLRQDDSPPKHEPQSRYPLRSRRSPIQYGSPNDTLEEPEYSPPEPGQPSIVNRDNDMGSSNRVPPPRKESNGRPYHAPQRTGSPMADVRIVRNHITSPAAPQPARVSPLAVAKAPPIPQSQYQQQGYKPQRPQHGHESARTSPEPEMSHPRKRRRGQDGNNNNKGRNGFNKGGPTPRKKPRHNQRVQDSPEPYIKEEPVSPPPFSNGPGLAPPKVRQIVDRSGPIESSSPREVRYVSYPEGREYEIPRQYVSNTESPFYPQFQYSCHRLETRRPIREEQDLRRVASYNARQPVMHQEYVDPVSPAHTRPARSQSYAIIDRQAQPQQPQFYEDEVATYAVDRRVIRSARSPSPVLRERYAEMEAPARMMAPPQRRIVMDENGNKYYEAAPVPRVQQSMALPSRAPRTETYQESVPMRQPAIRATSVFEDPQSGRRYISEIPPPQPGYRRVGEIDDPYQGRAVVERRIIERPEYEQRPMYRSASVQVLDYPQRQSRYIEEAPAPREEIVRMSSARPVTSRYEEQPQLIQRVQSVRPEAREVSALVDDDLRRPRENVQYVQAPVERVPYGYVRQPREERYIEEDEMGRVVMEGPRSGGSRVVQRY